MNDTIVLKFGGSSVANNERLKIVAEKIINLHNKKNKIVVILSAQGKTTDKLLGNWLIVTRVMESPNWKGY